ncbi:hypothetical protein [Streptomyces niveus]|uniref:hypothetical protein n=1 Tax=Streptomyces niveus TaxID=193462 RepID=UPI0036D3AA56
MGIHGALEHHGVERDNDVRRSLVRARPGAARQALLELMYTPAWPATHTGPYRTLGDPGMSCHAQRSHLAADNQIRRLAAPARRRRTDSGRARQGRPAPSRRQRPLLANRVPGAQLHMIPGARHACFEEFRTVASPLVLDFLTAGPQR